MQDIINHRCWTSYLTPTYKNFILYPVYFLCEGHFGHPCTAHKRGRLQVRGFFRNPGAMGGQCLSGRPCAPATSPHISFTRADCELYRQTRFFVGWSEARSPTCKTSLTTAVGLRTSLQPTKILFYTLFIFSVRVTSDIHVRRISVEDCRLGGFLGTLGQWEVSVSPGGHFAHPCALVT